MVVYYKCRHCKDIVEAGQRLEHAKTHHPAVPMGKMLFFVETDFIKSNNTHAPLLKANTDNATLSKNAKDPQKETHQLERTKIHSVVENSEIDIQNYKPANFPIEPRSRQPKDLFEYAVKKIAQRYQTDAEILAPKTHNEWMNYCFDRRYVSTPLREEYMSRIKATYADYFKRGAGRKYTFDFEKIARDYSHFFAFGKHNKPKHKGIEGMIEALNIEIKLSRQPDKRERYKIEGIDTINASKHLYALRIVIDESKNTSFSESLNATLRINDSWYNCDCIDFSEDESILYVSCDRSIYGHEGMLYLDTTFILQKILERLVKIKEEGLGCDQPAKKFLDENLTSLKEIAPSLGREFAEMLDEMDNGQEKAIDAAIRNEITFVWGPPGTGKSYTMAALINILDQQEESTLVCCVSNVAVDQLLNKVLDTITWRGYHPYNCEFMRAGYTTDSRLLAADYLFPKDPVSDQLRRRIRDLNSSLLDISKHNPTKALIEQELILKEERIRLREELKKRTEQIIGKARTVFSTMAYYVLSSQLENKKFDNLIVDEASMLSIPYLMALGSNVFKRIILVGDPNQLGPISISPEDMLSKSVFDHCKVLDGAAPHPALSRLLVQRRSHSFIVNLTNDFFYEGKLKAKIENSPEWVHQGPFAGNVIKVINQDIDDDAVKMIGTSRRNFGTHNAIMSILDEYYDYFLESGRIFSIGIITPFRAQLRMYRAAIRDMYSDDGFWESIKVGTVHNFQGSECDLVIFDLVEKAPEKVSKLFNGKEGERLVNVALSRARHKLIIVGDTKRFLGGLGLATVSSKTCNVLGRLSDVTASNK